MSRWRKINLKNLKRRLEEADIWEKLYENEKLLKTSVTSRFTWGDVLDGMVDILPPRETAPLSQSRSEANRRFITFKAKKMKELFGTQRPQKPSYKSLYAKERDPKSINNRNFRSMIEKHQSERDKLFRNQNLHTPNLPKITEEDVSNEQVDVSQRDSRENSNNSDKSEQETVSRNDRPSQQGTLVESRERVRKRKLSNVPLGKGSLTLAKSNLVLEGVPQQMKVSEQTSKKSQGKRKESIDSFAGYSKLPPISNSDEQ